MSGGEGLHLGVLDSKILFVKPVKLGELGFGLFLGFEANKNIIQYCKGTDMSDHKREK